MIRTTLKLLFVAYFALVATQAVAGGYGKKAGKDIADGLKFARMWGSEVFDGQQVGPDHEVNDGDLVELHAS